MARKTDRVRHGETCSDGVVLMTPLYHQWSMLKDPSRRPMLPSWRHSYIAFRDYIVTSIGDRPEGMVLNRINKTLDFVPGNVEWAPRVRSRAGEQSPHLRSNRPNQRPNKPRQPKAVLPEQTV